MRADRVLSVAVAAACLLAAVWLLASRGDEARVQAAVDANLEGRAQAALRQAAAVDGGPAHGRALAARGFALATLGRDAEAATVLGAAARRRPNDWAVHRDLALVRLRLGDRRGARRAMGRALALNRRLRLPTGFRMRSDSSR